jgi:outer membrane protein OmpA-like peptidoglycan-associated protein
MGETREDGSDLNIAQKSAAMNPLKIASISAAALILATAVPTSAQNAPEPWAQVETTSAIVGLGGQSGEGQLTMSNLGSNCVYPFKVSGFGADIKVGISKIAAAGPVKNLTRLEDFAGNYQASGGEVTVIAGGGSASMKNTANNVSLQLSAQTAGLNIGVAGQGLTISMPVPPVNAPRVYTLEFGFNKDWLNKAHHAQLDQLLAAWKCRFGTIEIVGYADAVGKEDDNLKLSVRRATAVRDYLIGGGIYATRIQPLAAGENNQKVATYQEQRLRANRVVVVTIKP